MSLPGGCLCAHSVCFCPFLCADQGGFSWRSLWPGGSLLCAQSPPYVLSYVLLLVQMAGGGPLMRLFFISVCYL